MKAGSQSGHFLSSFNFPGSAALLIRSVGTRPDGGKGVALGHALRLTDNDNLYYNFLLFVCSNTVIGLNQFIRPIDVTNDQLDLCALTIVNGGPGLHENERKDK